MLMGLLNPDAGGIRVLGLNPARQAIEIRRRIGFMAEDQVMFGWMRVRDLLRFMAPFYPTWDHDLEKRYVQLFELPLKTRVKHLSKGQNVRLALLLALAHRPELVILDDPTLGLDPIMRKEFLRDVIDHLQSGGITVFFSSHLLYEIEPVADVVAILDRGRIVRQAPTEELREQVKRLVLSEGDWQRVRSLPGALDVQQRGQRFAVVVENAAEAVSQYRAAGVQPEVVDLNLDEIFEAYVTGKPHVDNAPQPDLERVA
jgi:ABC-2 type transport system ATP-binding protein